MDESVLRAVVKWPDAPAVYGWLGLDRRGRWLLRGEVLEHPHAIAFIGRNYAADEGGCWYFQNGPQRVYVALEYAPWVCRLTGDGGMVTHTGLRVDAIEGAWLDEGGSLVLATAHGAALLEDRDLAAIEACFATGGSGERDDDAVAAAAERLAVGESADLRIEWAGRVVPVGHLASGAVPGRFGFVRDPAPV